MHNGHGQVPSAWDVRSTLEVMDDAAFIFDERATLVFVNRAAMRVFGFESFDDAKRHFEGHINLKVQIVVLRPDGPTKPGELIRQALLGVSGEEELERVMPPGRPQLILRVTVRPIACPSGTIIGALKLCRDVTFEYELDRLKEEFVRLTCHELRTPATILQLAAHRLLSGETSAEEVRQRAETIDRASRRIASLSQKLVDIAAITTGNALALDLSETRLDALVADVVAAVDGTDAGRVQLTSIPIAVRADGKRLKQVVDALVDNALRYSPAPKRIEVAVVARDGLAEVSVADHGIGIPAQKQRHIFEQFYRAHTDTPFDCGGLGASLYLADQIMKAHGGRISFESREAGGSTFRIALAAAQP